MQALGDVLPSAAFSGTCSRGERMSMPLLRSVFRSLFSVLPAAGLAPFRRRLSGQPALIGPVLLVCCLFLGGCLEGRLPEGVVATVNGDPIYLRTVQALLDGRSAALDTMQRPSLENMKRQYGDALGTLIIYALVNQELRNLQIPVTDSAVESAVAHVRADYGGEEELVRFLAEESLDVNEWRLLMRDHLAMQSFEKRVLLPGIRISLDNVRGYYKKHEAEFNLPETLDICLISAPDRQGVDSFCASFASVGPVREELAGEVLLQCVEAGAAQLPKESQKGLEKLAPGQCLPPRQEGDRWLGLALVRRNAAHVMSVAEAYPLIENILREREKEAAFERWLTAALSRAQVRVNPDLAADLLTPPSARTRAREGASSGSSDDNGSGGKAVPAEEGESENQAGPEEPEGQGSPTTENPGQGM